MTKEKKCSKCGEVRGVEFFGKDRCRPDGVRCQCKVCAKKCRQEGPKVRAERRELENALFLSGKKTCTKCGEIKGLECFSKHKRMRDGLATNCKSCFKSFFKVYRQENKEGLSTKGKIYYQNNKDTKLEYGRVYRQNNKEAKADYNRVYRQENKEALLGYNKSYYQDNRESFYASNAKRRSRKLNATPEWLTEQQDLKIELIYKVAKALEMMDGVKRHVDHIVPLKGKGVRGLHVPWNLQVLTAEQNLSKNNSYSDW